MGKGKLVETSFPFPMPLPFQKLRLEVSKTKIGLDLRFTLFNTVWFSGALFVTRPTGKAQFATMLQIEIG